MTTALGKDDWDRIVHALSQFGHNPEFQATLTRVLAMLNRPG